jgi:hypothetical protein
MANTFLSLTSMQQRMQLDNLEQKNIESQKLFNCFCVFMAIGGVERRW